MSEFSKSFIYSWIWIYIIWKMVLPKQPSTVESQYVAQTVGKRTVLKTFFVWILLESIILLISGPALAQGLAEIVQRRPNDPVEYLAYFLYKYVQNQEQLARDEKENGKKILEEIKLEETKSKAEQRWINNIHVSNYNWYFEYSIIIINFISE